MKLPVGDGCSSTAAAFGANLIQDGHYRKVFRNVIMALIQTVLQTMS